MINLLAIAAKPLRITPETIKEDCLGTYMKLNEIESEISNGSINENNFKNTKYTIDNIIKVYNENVCHVNQKVTNDVVSTTQEYEKRKSNNSLSYNEECEYVNSRHEISDLRGAAYYLSNGLPQRILAVLERSNQYKLNDNSAPYEQLAEISKEVLPLFFRPTLRLCEDFQEARDNRIAEQRAAYRLEQSTKLVSTSPHHIKITVNCVELNTESTLGICCEPNWASQPIAFTKNEQGNWCGQIPMDTDWKCVVIQDGNQVVLWEKLEGNRRCDAQTQPFTLHAAF
jgi:hypothetical protein